MYACLKCGFLHSGEVKTKFEKHKAVSANRMMCGKKAWEGIRHYRECPECKEIMTIKIVVELKNER